MSLKNQEPVSYRLENCSLTAVFYVIIYVFITFIKDCHCVWCCAF